MKPWFALFASIGLAACTEPEPPSGKQLFVANCAACHGADGRGTGWVAAGLSRKPADLTRISARNGGPFPMAEVLSNIDGFHRRAPSGSVMPEFGYLFEGPMTQTDTGDGRMTPVPEPLLAVAEYLESLQVD